jgi:hypothetical protein
VKELEVDQEHGENLYTVIGNRHQQAYKNFKTVGDWLKANFEFSDDDGEEEELIPVELTSTRSPALNKLLTDFVNDPKNLSKRGRRFVFKNVKISRSFADVKSSARHWLLSLINCRTMMS